VVNKGNPSCSRRKERRGVRGHMERQDPVRRRTAGGTPALVGEGYMECHRVVWGEMAGRGEDKQRWI